MNDKAPEQGTGYLEHANMNVRSLDKAVEFLKTAFPEFEVRGGGENSNLRWLHIGTDTSYIALSEPLERNLPPHQAYATFGVNHLGFIVGNVAEVKARLLAAGYQEGFRVVDHLYRKRLYIHDSDGFEWEFVEYLTDDPAKRNEYSGD